MSLFFFTPFIFFHYFHHNTDDLYRDFITLSKEVSKALRNTGYLPDINGESSSSSCVSPPTNSSSDNCETNETCVEPQPGPSGLQQDSKKPVIVKDNPAMELYKKVMKDVQIDTCEFTMSGASSHAFASAFSKAGTPSASIIFRVAQELSSLSTSLPLDFSSGIFLRTDDDRPTLMKVLITG